MLLSKGTFFVQICCSARPNDSCQPKSARKGLLCPESLRKAQILSLNKNSEVIKTEPMLYLMSTDFQVIFVSLHIHLTQRVQHTVLSRSYRKTSFAFPKGLVKPLNLESLPQQENKKLQNKLPAHHFESFNERIQN